MQIVLPCCIADTRLVVNDRLVVALACAADGVLLRADSIPVEAARRLAPPGFLVGRSVHGAGEAAAAAGANYVIAGTVFPSESKRSRQPLLVLDGLRAVVSAMPVPVLAIGGITGARLDEVAAAGPAGVAAIGLFMAPAAAGDEAGRISCRAVPLAAVVERARAHFAAAGDDVLF